MNILAFFRDYFILHLVKTQFSWKIELCFND